MMLESIRLQNFLCFDEYSYQIKLNKLNVIIGENNSGKSTLFHAVNVIRHLPSSRNGQIPWNSAYYSLHDHLSATYAHDSNRAMSIAIDGNINGVNFGWSATKKSEQDRFEPRVFLHERNNAAIDGKQSRTMASTIWYFSPKRDSINFEQGVGGGGDALQPISPTGSNISQFLLEQFTTRNPLYEEAEKWLKKIDPQMTILKSPLRSTLTSIETTRNDGKTTMDINLSLQGSGIQNATTIICGLIFSPEASTIIIEEPENFLHHRSMETIVDLINHVVNNLNKQVIITTHSMDILNDYIKDLGITKERSADHVRIKPEHFKLFAFFKKIGAEKIIEKNLQEIGKYSDARSFIKDILG